MLGRPGALTAAAGPVPGKATLVANSIPVPKPRSRPRKLDNSDATTSCRDFDAQDPRRPVAR